jgi:hypothetical protein
VDCGVWGVRCGVGGGGCGVWGVECAVWGVGFGCGLWVVGCEVSFAFRSTLETNPLNQIGVERDSHYQSTLDAVYGHVVPWSSSLPILTTNRWGLGAWGGGRVVLHAGVPTAAIKPRKRLEFLVFRR